MDELEFECERCGKPIPPGTAYISITRNIEQVEHSLVDNEDQIRILHADELVTLCSACGNLFDTESLINIIKNLPGSYSEVKNN
jgi:hypothetical protein